MDGIAETISRFACITCWHSIITCGPMSAEPGTWVLTTVSLLTALIGDIYTLVCVDDSLDVAVPVACMSIMWPRDLDIWPFCPKTVLSITCATRNSSTTGCSCEDVTFSIWTRTGQTDGQTDLLYGRLLHDLPPWSHKRIVEGCRIMSNTVLNDLPLSALGSCHKCHRFVPMHPPVPAKISSRHSYCRWQSTFNECAALIIIPEQSKPVCYYAPAPRVGGIKRWCASDVCLSRTSDLSGEQRGLGRLKLAQR